MEGWREVGVGVVIGVMLLPVVRLWLLCRQLLLMVGLLVLVWLVLQCLMGRVAEWAVMLLLVLRLVGFRAGGGVT